MPRADMTKYQAIDHEQQVVHAQVVDVSQISKTPLINTIAFITEDTPQSIRQNFIYRVYIILWFQIAFTAGYIGLCNQIQPLQKFMLSPSGINLFWISGVSMLIMSCCLLCTTKYLRKFPWNCLYLTYYTCSMSYILGYVGIAYKLTTLLLSGLSTLGIFTGLTLYAIQTKYDYTEMGGYLISLFMGFIIFSFMVPFIHSSTMNILYASGGSILFSFYIVYDTQLIVGGKHRKIMFQTDDYVIAAISLYLDIINLFLYMIDLLNGGQRN